MSGFNVQVYSINLVHAVILSFWLCHEFGEKMGAAKLFLMSAERI